MSNVGGIIMRTSVDELKTAATNSDASSDSEQEYRYRTLAEPPYFNETEYKRELEKILSQINSLLQQGKTVDLSIYPPLFFVNFRGTHFFKNFFPHQTRKEIRSKIKNNLFKEGIYSPAAYELAGLPIGAPLDTPEKKQRMRESIKLLNEKMDGLGKTKNTQPAWYGKNRTHENLLLQHYQRYVNNYETFRQESEMRYYSCFQLLPSSLNPYISTADDARHAVQYALGGKTEVSQGCLRPSYTAIPAQPERAKHPKTGYVQIIFHSLTSLARHKPFFLSHLHASKKIDIDSRLLNERETAYKAGISSKHIVHTEVLRYPSFNVAYYAGYHRVKYGIDNGSYTRYAKLFRPGNRVKETTLLDKLTEHYAKQLKDKAYEIAKARGGFIVYFGLDGFLHSSLPATQIVSTGRATANYQYDILNTLGYFRTTLSDSDGELNPGKDDATLLARFNQLGINNKNSKHAYFEHLHTAYQHMDWQDHRLPRQQNNLLQNAAARGFTCVNVPGEGRCFYHAVLHQLQTVLNLPEYQAVTAQQLIESAIDYIITYIDCFVVITQSKNHDDFINRLLKPGTWADRWMIQALACSHKVTIEITSSDNAQPTIIYTNPSMHTIHLGYEVGWHYQSLCPVNQNQSTMRRG